MFPSTSSGENKTNCFPWDHTLSVYCSLQCVQTIVSERGCGVHFPTFAVFLSTLTLTRHHWLWVRSMLRCPGLNNVE